MIIAYDDEGTGPAVLLLHSGVTDRRMWDPQWAALTAVHRVIRCDLRGFGETPLPPDHFSFADDVIALLDHVGVDQVALVGSSFGGRVALETATTSPARVTRLVLLCTALRGVESTAAIDEFAAREEALLEADDRAGYVELNVTTWLGPDADDSTRDRVRAMQRGALDVQLAAEQADGETDARPVDVDPGRIDIPTVAISGGHDLDFFQSIATHLAATMPQARHIHLPWAGHLPSMERPEQTTELLLALLGSPASDHSRSERLTP